MKQFIPFLLLFAISHVSISLQAAEVMKTAVFQRIAEPNEQAFSLLVPKGWLREGGIFRVDPTAQGGPSQSIAAKLDFAVKKDPAGSVMIRWLPDMLYFDASRSPAGQMGLFPPGSNYQGMTVSPVMSAAQFIQQVVFPYAHPSASDVKITKQQRLPKIAQKFQQQTAAMIPGSSFSYDAALLSVTYRENGVRYEEKIVTVIENWGQLGAGMWGNKETFLVRTPLGKFARWEPVVSVIRNSVKLNLQWIAGEMRGQRQRSQIAINTQRKVQEIGRQIAEHRQKTNAEINNDMFLTLMEQEEYVNPHTKEIETGSNQWKHRWINENEEVIYTDNESYDPNTDVHLNRSGYKRTPIRKRFPQK